MVGEGMRFSSLHVFISILDQGSFAQAAKLEHLSQPALSAIISAMEEELGFQLLIRSSGQRSRIEPTPAGAVFAEFSRKTLADYNQTLLRVASQVSSVKPFTIVVSASPAASVFPVLAHFFKSQYPTVQFQTLVASSAHDIFSTLLYGQSAICVSGSRPQDPRLVSEPFFFDPPVLVCPNDMALRPSISLRELTTLPLIHRPEQSSNFSRLVLQALQKKNISKDDLNIVMEVSGDADILHAVSLSAGVGFISRSLYETSGAASCVRYVHVRGLTMNRYLYLSHRADVSLTLEMRLFIECAKGVEWRKNHFFTS